MKIKPAPRRPDRVRRTGARHSTPLPLRPEGVYSVPHADIKTRPRGTAAFAAVPMSYGVCTRCGSGGAVLTLDKKTLCVPCGEMKLDERANYRERERRDPGHEARGFGRRARDIVRPR